MANTHASVSPARTAPTVSRRTVMKTAIWSAPVVALAVTAPAASASDLCPVFGAPIRVGANYTPTGPGGTTGTMSFVPKDGFALITFNVDPSAPAAMQLTQSGVSVTVSFNNNVAIVPPVFPDWTYAGETVDGAVRHYRWNLTATSLNTTFRYSVNNTDPVPNSPAQSYAVPALVSAGSFAYSGGLPTDIKVRYQSAFVHSGAALDANCGPTLDFVNMTANTVDVESYWLPIA